MSENDPVGDEITSLANQLEQITRTFKAKIARIKTLYRQTDEALTEAAVREELRVTANDTFGVGWERSQKAGFQIYLFEKNEHDGGEDCDQWESAPLRRLVNGARLLPDLLKIAVMWSESRVNALDTPETSDPALFEEDE